MLDTLESELKWARQLTLDLLAACSETDLQFTLNESCGPLWKQFRHIGRVHENYLNAIESGEIQFDTEDCSFQEEPTVAALQKYFENIGKKHSRVIERSTEDLTVSWFGERTTLPLHLIRLLCHETLHHGQLILYWRALGKSFPNSWEAWGEGSCS